MQRVQKKTADTTSSRLKNAPQKKKRVLNGKEVHIHEDQQWKQVCINEKKKKKKKEQPLEEMHRILI